MKEKRCIFGAMVLAAVLLPGPAVAQSPPAEVRHGATSIDWSLRVENNGAVLAVQGPEDSSYRREFKAGETPTFDTTDEKGNRLLDGAYTWELRVVPVVSQDVAERLNAVRGTPEEKDVIWELRRAGKIPREPVAQSGSFTISGGTIVPPDLFEADKSNSRRGGKRATSTSTSGSGLTPTTAADQVIPDDLIVQGSLCVGLDCVVNENFGFDTIRLKENNTRVKFEDTSVGTFPTNDWQLTANDSASGGSSKFSIEDITGAKVPFTITAGASTNSIFVDSTGRVGFRTSTPVLDLHVATSNTPAIRLEQNNSGGFTAQTWDIAGNEANFFVRDVTGGSRLPFRIRPGAPTSSIDISADGLVGFGTASPDAKIDVEGDSAAESGIILTTFSDTDSPQVRYRRARGTPSVPTAVLSGDVLGSFAFAGHNGTSIPGTNSALVLAAAEENWTSTATGSRLTFNTTAVGTTTQQTRMTIGNNGNVGIGTTTPAGRLDVNGSIFQRGVQIHADYVFEPGYKLDSIAENAAVMWATKHLPAIGPRRVDEEGREVIELGADRRGIVEELEKAHIYIARLDEQLRQKEEKLSRVEQLNAELAERLSRIEALLDKNGVTEK